MTITLYSGRQRNKTNTTANPNLGTRRDHVTQQRTKIRKPALTTAPQADARAPHTAIIKFKAGTKKINAYTLEKEIESVLLPCKVFQTTGAFSQPKT